MCACVRERERESGIERERERERESESVCACVLIYLLQRLLYIAFFGSREVFLDMPFEDKRNLTAMSKLRTNFFFHRKVIC